MSNKNLGARIGRRQLLAWSAPVITAVSLPAHAATTGCGCGGPPVLTVSVPPRCAGNPPVGTAVIEITGPDACPMGIESIDVVSEDDKSSLHNLPAFPFYVTRNTPATFEWIGHASDGISCLPLHEISLTVHYACEDGKRLSASYNLTQLLAASIA